MKGFQIDCCKTKTKVITTAIQKKRKINNWFIRQLCVHRDMKHAESLESTQEARVALGYASSNSYASFVGKIVSLEGFVC